MSVPEPVLRAFKKGLPTVGVSVVVFWKGHVLLLERRNPPLIWWVPAGYLEKGEEWLAAAARELLEETGIRAPLTYVGVFNEVFPELDDHVVEVVFTAHVDAPDVCLNNEAWSFRWHPIVRVAELHPNLQQEIRAALPGRLCL